MIKIHVEKPRKIGELRLVFFEMLDKKMFRCMGSKKRTKDGRDFS